MKKIKLLPVILITMVLVTFSFWGCNPNNTDIPNYTTFVMRIDSIHYPSSIFMERDLNIKFFGTIGPDGCYTFSHFSPLLKNKNINVTVYGRHVDKTTCNDAISYLYGATLDVAKLDTGRYIIHVIQPSPPDIYDTVYVKMR